jgi:hypothetical protein
LRGSSSARSKAVEPDVRYTAGTGSGLLKVARMILPMLFDKAVQRTFGMHQKAV